MGAAARCGVAAPVGLDPVPPWADPANMVADPLPYEATVALHSLDNHRPAQRQHVGPDPATQGPCSADPAAQGAISGGALTSAARGVALASPRLLRGTAPRRRRSRSPDRWFGSAVEAFDLTRAWHGTAADLELGVDFAALSVEEDGCLELGVWGAARRKRRLIR